MFKSYQSTVEYIKSVGVDSIDFVNFRKDGDVWRARCIVHNFRDKFMDEYEIFGVEITRYGLYFEVNKEIIHRGYVDDFMEAINFMLNWWINHELVNNPDFNLE